MKSWRDHIDDVDAKLDPILKAMDSELEAIRRDFGVSEYCPIPEELHHYTNVQGLLGILRTGKIWATYSSSSCLNDTKEIDYGRQIAIEVIHERIPHHAGVTRRALEDCIGRFNSGPFRIFSLYIASFSARGDDLELWTRYGDKYRGFDLCLTPSQPGIDPKQLPWRPDRPYQLWKVIYDKKIQKSMFEKIIEKGCGLVQLHSDSLKDTFPQFEEAFPQFPDFPKEMIYLRMQTLLFKNLCLLFHCFKESSWSVEHEYRFVYAYSPAAAGGRLEQEIRSINNVNCPYFELPLFSNDVNKMAAFKVSGITHGPTPHPDLPRIRDEIEKMHNGPIEIRSSSHIIL